MSGRPKLWFVLALVFVAVNLGWAVYAALRGEMRHGLLHAFLVVPGVWAAMRLSRRDRQPAIAAAETNVQLDQLQQSLDAIAIEVERIGEAQRFTARLAQQEQGERVRAGPDADSPR